LQNSFAAGFRLDKRIPCAHKYDYEDTERKVYAHKHHEGYEDLSLFVFSISK